MAPAPSGGGEERGRRLPAWASWLALAVVGAAVALYLRRHGGALVAGLELRPRHLVALAAVEVALLVLRGLLTRTLCARFGVALGVAESARLSAWTSVANYVAPLVGGTGLRALYLKRQHSLPLASFVSVQMATYTLHFQVAAALGLVCLPFLPGSAGPGRGALALLLAAVLAGCLLLHHWPFAPPRGAGRVAQAVGRVLLGWAEIRRGERGGLLLLLSANALAQALGIWLGFAALGLESSALQALFVAAVYSLSILLAVTPAALGISEGAVVLAATAAGLAGPPALAAAATRRVVAFVVAALAAGTATLGGERERAPSPPAPVAPESVDDDLAAALAAGAHAAAPGRPGALARVLLALVALVYAMAGLLVFRLNLNWDEFHYLSYVHDLERGDLHYRWATFHAHLFRWLTALDGGEVSEVIAARAVLALVAAGSGWLLYRVARRLLSREAALFAVLAFASFSFVLRSGASFRPDPICVFLLLAALDLLLPPRGMGAALGAGVALGVSAMVTVKAGLHLALVAAIAALLLAASPRARPRLARQLAAAAAAAVLTFLVLFAFHGAGVTELPAGAVAASPSGAAAKVFGTGALLPRREVFVRACRENPLFWTTLVAGLAVALFGLRQAAIAARGRSLLLLLFAAPVASIAVYRNAFPYFYVFVLPLAAVTCGAAAEAALAAERRGGPRVWRALVAVAAVTFFSGAFAYAWRHRTDETVAQRQLLDVVHRMFPAPVAYVDRCSMVASFPKAGFFMSSWGIQSYRERGRPIFADLLRERPVGFLIANSDALRLDLPDALLARMPWSLLGPDVETLRENFVHHWGPLFVQGKAFRFAAADGARAFEILSAGPYTLESAGNVRLDGVERRPGEVVTLATGAHAIEPVAGVRDAVLRFGDHLWRPDFPPLPRPIFLDF